ncbi:asparagine synthase-related protein [Dyadobacter sp. 3J3]|uniref:asparagine synthase-related protein n=1 Tax=Dyadobacter sp. 3J3 TaxID=2606600 RepID=UPI00135BC5E7|nr:asparagine synthase-related protein [Dyadobacter sp. 3J3]
MVLEGFVSFNYKKLKTGLFVDDQNLENFILDNCSFNIKSISKQPDDNNYVVINSKSSSTRLIRSKISYNLDLINRFFFDTTVKSISPQPHISIWYDENSRQLSIIRHNLGITPLYYIYVPGTYFTFSTDLTSLIRTESIVKSIGINNNWVASYLSGSGNNPYTADTVYNSVKRLLPGHNLLLTDSGNKVTEIPFFSYKPEKWNKIKTMPEYGEVFKDLFQKSVKQSISSDKPTIAQLSGGLDSSSISCVARELFPNCDLHTVFLDIPITLRSEKHLALEVANQIRSKHHVLEPSIHDLDSLILHTSLYGSPEEMISGSALTRSIQEKARDVGALTMLNGHDGDGIVGIGIEYPEILYDQYKWQELKELLDIASMIYPYYDINSNWDSLSSLKKQENYVNHFLYRQLVRKRKELSPQNFLLHVFKIHDFFGNSSAISLFIKSTKALLNKIKTGNIYPNSILRDDFTQNLPLKSFQLNLPDTMSKELDNIDIFSFKDIYGGESITVPEKLYALRKHYGVVEKFPFFDNDLFEFTMSVPLSIKWDKGRKRAYLREGMKGILPENIRTRGDKGKFSLYGREVAIRLYSQSRDFLLPENEIWNYVDFRKFNTIVKILHQDQQPGRATFQVLRTIFLAIWLEWLKNEKIIASS